MNKNEHTEKKAIVVRHVFKHYGKVEALKDVNFTVEKGEIFGLIGPDGAGKTTLFRLLATLLLPDTTGGTAEDMTPPGIAVDGHDAGRDMEEIRKCVGYMPGKFSLYQDLSVEENLEFFATLFGTTVEAEYDNIKAIYQQIEPFRRRKAGALSGGMKQKLALCCALVHKPSILLLDEPTTGVDPVSRKELWDMLATLRHRGITIVVSTPYLDEVRRCHRIAFLQQGKVMGIGKPEEILLEFKDVFMPEGVKSEERRVKSEGSEERRVKSEGSEERRVKSEGSEERRVKSEGSEERRVKSEGSEERRVKSEESNSKGCCLNSSNSFNSSNSSNSSSLSIEVSHLVKAFGSFRAVDDISFCVKRGEIFGFLGANGAGKTTAMHILTGLSQPTSGTGQVAGCDICTEYEQIKKHIGYMSQKFSLYADLTVRENIRLFGGIYGMNDRDIRRKTDELLSQLQFADHADDIVASLPLGWKQKLAFSVSIFHNPEIVFLDEPTGGVDPATRRQFWQLIYEAADRGITVFVTTHYMDEAEYCDRISIMVDGKIKAMGTPDYLKRTLHQPDMDGVFTHLARQSTRK